ncbi:MAG: lysylphosphatidylglycerol synthase transmembrane domain-containing protein [bacterium]
MKNLWSWAKKILPWLVTAGLFAYLFHQIPPEKVAKALSFIHPILFTVYAIAYFFVIMLIDSYSLSRVLNQFCVPVSFREILPARGVSYLLSLVNYNAGQAGLALYLKRSKNASFFKALGSILFILVIDLYWVVLFAFVGSFFIQLELGKWNVSDWVQKVGLILFVGLLIHLAFWRNWFSKLFRVNIRVRFLDWIRGRHLFQTFHEATVLDYLKIALLRLPMHAVIISSLYIVVTTFQAKIPFFTILTTVPVILLVGVLPITPGGLGTVQAATIQFLKGSIVSPLFSQGQVSPEELLFALALLWMFANYILKALFGALCLKRVQGNLFKGESAA